MNMSFSVPQRMGTLFALIFVLALQPLAAQDAVVLNDQQPEPQNLVEIYKAMEYPKAAYEAKQEGMVVVRVMVDKQGQYKKHEIVKQSDPAFGAAVEAQVQNLKFKPARKDGKSVEAWVMIPFKFSL